MEISLIRMIKVEMVLKVVLLVLIIFYNCIRVILGMIVFSVFLG